MEFGQGTVVPLVKKTGDISSHNIYRAITVIPIICKLFENILLEVCDEYINSHNRQIGFKKYLLFPVQFLYYIALWTTLMMEVVLCMQQR